MNKNFKNNLFIICMWIPAHQYIAGSTLNTENPSFNQEPNKRTNLILDTVRWTLLGIFFIYASPNKKTHQSLPLLGKGKLPIMTQADFLELQKQAFESYLSLHKTDPLPAATQTLYLLVNVFVSAKNKHGVILSRNQAEELAKNFSISHVSQIFIEKYQMASGEPPY